MGAWDGARGTGPAARRPGAGGARLPGLGRAAAGAGRGPGRAGRRPGLHHGHDHAVPAARQGRRHPSARRPRVRLRAARRPGYGAGVDDGAPDAQAPGGRRRPGSRAVPVRGRPQRGGRAPAGRPAGRGGPRAWRAVMMLLGLVAVAASVMLALASGGLSRRLAPALAVPLLTLLALATSLATGLVLCVAAFGALAQLPFLATLGGWSGEALAPGNLAPGWGVVAGGIAAALLAAALVVTVRAARSLAQAGRACRQLAGPDRLVITRDDRPAAYAVPSRAGAIVVSTGMLALLSAPERQALLAHEEAHLRHRHAVYVLLADLAAAANPLLRPLAGQVRLAVELQADEDAARFTGDRRTVARALARA